MLLDAMRKHSRSFIIYIFFGIIIAVFVVNFGPQSGGGCGSAAVSAGSVEGTKISPSIFNYAVSASGVMQRFANLPEHLLVRVKGRIMDQLIVRELLAEDALSMGFRIPDKEINDMIVKGRFVIMGQAQPLILNDDGKFDYSRFSRWVRYRWGLTVKNFKAQQRRELLAEKIRRLYRGSVKASEDEVKQSFLHQNTKVELAYVAFPPHDFRDKVVPGKADLDNFIAKNKKDIEEYYKTNKTAYEKLPAQVRLQVLTVKIPSADKTEEAKAKAEALHKRLAGGEDFATVAREASEDSESRARGGILGWRNEDSPGLGDKARALITGAKEGKISELVQEKDSFVVFKLLGRRKGDLDLKHVEAEIAEQLYTTKHALALATKAADGFIKRSLAGESLENLFTTSADKEGADEEEADPAKKGDEKVETTDTEAKDTEAEEKIAAKEEVEEEPAKPEKSPLELSATTAFTRSGQYLVPGIGVSKELTTAAFKLKEGETAPKSFVVGEMVYLVQVKKRQDADMGEWTKNQKDLTETYLDTKAGELLRQYMALRCKKVIDAGRVVVNTGILVTPGYAPTKKDPPLPQYQACSSLKRQSLM